MLLAHQHASRHVLHRRQTRTSCCSAATSSSFCFTSVRYCSFSFSKFAISPLLASVMLNSSCSVRHRGGGGQHVHVRREEGTGWDCSEVQQRGAAVTCHSDVVR
jgi:hypothetical protein